MCVTKSQIWADVWKPLIRENKAKQRKEQREKRGRDVDENEEEQRSTEWKEWGQKKKVERSQDLGFHTIIICCIVSIPSVQQLGYAHTQACT